MKTILRKLAEEMVSELENFAENNTEADAYNFEKGIVKILQENNKQLFQASLGKLPKGENSKVKIKTTLGEMIVPKTHPMSMRPMGFRITPVFRNTYAGWAQN